MNWRRNLWVLWFGVILSSSSYTMVVPFLPLYLLDIGVDQSRVTMWSGVIFSATFLVAAVLAPFWGRMADKTGKKRMVIRSGICLALVYFLGSLVQSPQQLLLMRILQGFANGFVPASMAIVTSSAPEHKMGYSLGMMQTALLTGGILGPLVGGVLSHLFGMRQSFVAASLFIFCGTMAVMFLVTEPKSTSPAKVGSILDDIKVAFSNRTLVGLLLLLMLVQMTAMVMQPLITVFVAQLQGKLEGAVLTSGFVFGLAGIAGAIAAPIWGKAGQKTGFSNVLILTLASAGLINAIQYFVGSIIQFSITQFVFGLFIAGVLPAINAIVVANTDPGFRGRAFGLTTSANQLGSMLGPIMGGLISTWFGIKMVFVFTGLLLVAAAFTIWHKKDMKVSSCLESR